MVFAPAITSWWAQILIHMCLPLRRPWQPQLTALRLPHPLLTTCFGRRLNLPRRLLTLQVLSNGRFEAGLGAGWAEHEMLAMGLDYPDPPTRVSMYLEALAIVRALLMDGQCRFNGDHYQVDLSGEYRLGPMPATPPPLIASAGGPRNIRESTPLVDRVEIKASARGTRGGALDLAEVALVTEADVRDNVQRVKQINPELPVGIFLLVGTGEMANGLKAQFGNGFPGRFIGHAEDVAEALSGLAELGIDRVQLTELLPGSQQQLQPLLCSQGT